jgi:hypothetical protein
MPPAIQLRVAPSDGRLRLTISDGLTRPVEAEIPAFPPEQLQVVPPHPSRVLLPGRDIDWMRAEDAASQNIAKMLSSAGPVWAHLQMLRGGAEALHQKLVVAVDVEAPEWREVPWELLSLGEGALESEGDGVVARLGAGPAGSRKRSELIDAAMLAPGACVWRAGEDSISQDLAAEVERQIEAAGLTRVDVDQHPSLLWVVAHGERAADAVEVATSEGSKGAGAVCARLADALPTARAVILAVCHAGPPGLDPLAALSGRLLASGAGLVVAPITSVHVDAIRRFTEGFLEGVREGQSLGRCVARGRREVRAWALGHATARWRQLQCWVSSVSNLEVVLLPRHFRPAGWPRPDPAAGRWLDAAFQLAVHDHLGVEHLLQALMGLDGGGPVTAAVRWAARRWLEPYESTLSEKLESRSQEGQSTLELTPRLLAIGARLAPGFGMEDLALQLDETRPRVPQEPTVAQTVQTVQTLETTERERGPARALQVYGGPEDGRILRPEPGQIIGRAGGSADIVLYEETRRWDQKMSREHVRWDGDGQLTPLRPVQVRGAHAAQSVTIERGTPFVLSVGDELSFTRLTRVIGLQD